MKLRLTIRRETLKLIVISSILLALLVNLTTCSPPISPLQQIINTGELRVVTRENPATYFKTQGLEEGFEFDLAHKFADYLGVELKLYSASVSQALRDVELGRAHIAAAGLSITEARKLSVEFGPTYHEVTQQLIGRRDKKLPQEPSELVDYDIAVLADSSHQERLIQLQANFPKLHWEPQWSQSTIELMRLVEDLEYDLTIVDSVEFAVTQRYFPLLTSVFELAEPENIAWALPLGATNFSEKVNAFFQQEEDSGDLDQLKEYHFGYIKSFDYVEITSFTRDLNNRFPLYEELFHSTAKKYDLDWRLLAAISYQESHWRKNAVSVTGVKGLMMLTKHTAAEMNVENREDPAQSIDGGARYLLKIQEKIPERIEYPDRLWLALAGYNVGFGHLEDARILTERLGKNPDLWSDVRDHLPLLSQKKYYTTVKRGKARGSEPVKYVENIRDYYDLLRWLSRDDNSIDEEEQNNSEDNPDSSTIRNKTLPEDII